MSDEAFWIYENHVHKYAKVHRASCSFCNSGLGFHNAPDSRAGEWTFLDVSGDESARSKYPMSDCSVCTPGQTR